MIKDSGERREFESGAVRDIQEGKGRCDLLPLDVVSKMFLTRDEECLATIFNTINAFQNTGNSRTLFYTLKEFLYKGVFKGDVYDMLLELSIHFEEGASKYTENNWKLGINTKCYIDSAIRHLLKYLRGDDDERHDRAFVWNIMCCIWTCENKPELNDYAKKDVDNGEDIQR